MLVRLVFVLFFWYYLFGTIFLYYFLVLFFVLQLYILITYSDMEMKLKLNSRMKDQRSNFVYYFLYYFFVLFFVLQSYILITYSDLEMKLKLNRVCKQATGSHVIYHVLSPVQAVEQISVNKRHCFVPGNIKQVTRLTYPIIGQVFLFTRKKIGI